MESATQIYQTPTEPEIINDLFESFLNDHGQLWAWDCLDNDRDKVLIGEKPSKHQNIDNLCIVFQGPLNGLNSKITSFAIDRYLNFYPSIHIVVSSWAETPQRDLLPLVDKDRGNKKVHFKLSFELPFRGSGKMNTNLQSLSTQVGLREAQSLGAKYVLKHRTDVCFGEPFFIDTLLTFLHTFDKGVPNSQMGKIIVGSMNTFRARPFSVSDHFYFGYTADLQMMWDLKIPTSESDVRQVRIKPLDGSERIPINGEQEFHLAWSAKSTCMDESYFMHNLLEKSGMFYSYDWQDSFEFMAKCLIVIDTSLLNIFWPKYTYCISHSKYRQFRLSNFSHSQYAQREINFTEWLQWYNELR